MSMTYPLPEPNISHNEAWKQDKGVETVWHEEDQDFLCVIAPHGGDIEAETDMAAVETYKKMPEGTSSLWMFQAYDSAPAGENAAFEEYHVNSEDISSEFFPKLSWLEGVGFDYCLAYHVEGSADRFEVGGLTSSETREEVGEVLADATSGKWDYTTGYDEGEFMGEEPENIVNRLTQSGENGIQIEMPGSAAKEYRKRIAEDLAEYFEEISKNR